MWRSVYTKDNSQCPVSQSYE